MTIGAKLYRLGRAGGLFDADANEYVELDAGMKWFVLEKDHNRIVADLRAKLRTARHDALMEAAGIVDCTWSETVLRDMAADAGRNTGKEKT